jgi:PAS domain S-box-containing protein
MQMNQAKSGQREQLVATIALRIRQSLNLELILQTTVTEVRQLIKADRVLIYRFEPDASGIVINESVSNFQWSILDQVIKDSCFEESWLTPYQQGKIHSIADTNKSDLSSCYLEFLAEFQVKANIAVPILLAEEHSQSDYAIAQPSDRLWGLLIVHQCSSPRDWQESELELLRLLAIQVAIAIQQGELYQQVQTELNRRKQAEELYQVLVTSAPVGIFQTDAQGDCLFVNQRWQEMTEISFTAASGQGWLQALHPDDRDRVNSEWYNTTQTGQEFSLEYRFKKPQGQVIWVAGRAVPLYNDLGTVIGYLGTVTDISEQQAALRERQQREKILTDIASGVTTQTGENFFPSLVEYLTKTLEVDYASVCTVTTPERERVRILAFYDQKQGQTSLENFEYDLAGTPCGNVVGRELCIYPDSIQALFPDDHWLQDIEAEGYAGMPIFAQTGQALGLISIIDSKPLQNTELITEVLKIFASRATSELERQQAEIALRKSEQRFRGIFDQTFQFMGLLEPNGKIIEANQTALDFIGATVADVIGKPFWLTPWWAISEQARELCQQAVLRGAKGEFVRFEVDHLGTENHIITVDFSVTPVKDETGQVVMLIPEGRDISELKQAEAKIREQAALLDLAHDAILVRNFDNVITFWNRGAAEMYGWTKAEAIGIISHQLLQTKFSSSLTAIETELFQAGHWEGELIHQRQDGTTVIVMGRWSLLKDNAGHPKQILEIHHDITEQKQLESQFLRTQRLESLGTLAGGIAHDLNNILAPILGFAQLLPRKLTNLDEPTLRIFKIIETNAQRGTALVKQILTFARGLDGDNNTLKLQDVVQIRHLITEIRQIITETFPKTIELQVSIPKNLWTVNGDINQLHQVLMNLAVNARDAMPNGGRLAIITENFTVDERYARLHLEAEIGSYVLITVADTGIGIAPEIIDRIFEPFFTTKAVGRGTGLGLSTVIGIVKSHGGFIDVISETKGEHQGTQIKVFLPASETTDLATEETEIIPQGNGELILVVDDEIPILEVTKATLETYNYRVLTAKDGIEAIALYAQNHNGINLVIIDIMMPSMDGKTAIRTLKKINPDIKIIAISGLISSQEMITEIDNNVSAFISKPYSNDELLIIVNEIINC